MTPAQILGALLIAAVLAGLFAMTAQLDGWADAAIVWSISLAITAVVAVGAFLLVGAS
ncbi:MAG TPA: hypothetical protein VFY84_12645 [Jiangellales bacterium]|nr:hypothetical protein [Jiangellales bacterium]